MPTEPFKLLAADVVEKLSASIESNLERYRAGDFSDLAKECGWEIETTIANWDPSMVNHLDPSGTPDAEVRNSLLIFRAMDRMTPALAREERLWARLCHVECLHYARNRWLTGTESIAAQVRKHFFATGLRDCRDRNAIGRLWWNGHVASLASPDNIELGLKRLLSRANIRLQVIDRADTAFREPLIRGIFRMLGEEDWLDSYDAAVADFMYEVNKRSGGIMFEALDDAAVDSHLRECVAFAQRRKAT